LFTLATLPENNDPVISCYANVRERSKPALLLEFEERVRVLRKALQPEAMPGFEQALNRVNDRLRGAFKRGSEGVAVFARGGSDPFFLDLEFRVPLANRLSISPALALGTAFAIAAQSADSWTTAAPTRNWPFHRRHRERSWPEA